MPTNRRPWTSSDSPATRRARRLFSRGLTASAYALFRTARDEFRTLVSHDGTLRSRSPTLVADFFDIMNDSLTPMMQQYRELKARDPDALLLFRMGDFYEMFGDDAERASACLGLTLTSRDKGPDAVPMAGFPHPALDSYLAKIVQAGLRAAVCEQVEDREIGQGSGQARRRPDRHARDPD